MWRLSEAQRWSPSPTLRTLTVDYRRRRNRTIIALFPGWQGRRARFKRVECAFLSAPIISVSKSGPIRTRTNWRGRAVFRVEGGRELVACSSWFVMPDRDCSYIDIKREMRLASIGLRIPDGEALVGSPRLPALLRWCLRVWCRFRLWRDICPQGASSRLVGINNEPLVVDAHRCGQCVVCLTAHLTNRWVTSNPREDRSRIEACARSDIAFLYAEGKLNLVRRMDAYRRTERAFHDGPLAVRCEESRELELVGQSGASG